MLFVFTLFIILYGHFFSWPAAYAVLDKTAETIASLLIEKFYSNMDVRKFCCQTEGLNLSSIVSLLLERLKIGYIKTSPFHLQSNGKTERLHHFMNGVLAKYTQHDQFTWVSTSQECLWHTGHLSMTPHFSHHSSLCTAEIQSCPWIPS